MLVTSLKVSVIGTRGFPGVEGGVERHCECLYTRMTGRADVLVYRRKSYVETCRDYKGVRFRDLPSTRAKGFEALLHSFLATCSALVRRPDVVCYHNIGPALFSPLLKLRRIPIVLTYHSPNYEHDKWNSFAKTILRFSERVALKNAVTTIFVNRFQMEQCASLCRGKVVYIPNGVDVPALQTGTNVIERFGLEPGRYVLSVGRITPEKGFDILIDAFREVAPEDMKLVIVGGVESERGYAEKLREIAAEAPVVFTGELHDDELDQMYANASLYVLSSRNEGFPLALLEAMSHGLDVAVSDIPATHLLSLGVGDYFPVDNSFKLAEVLNKKLSEPVRRIYDLSPFNWDRIVQETLWVYEDAVEENRVMK